MAEAFERMATNLEKEGERGSAFVLRVAADMCRERARYNVIYPPRDFS